MQRLNILINLNCKKILNEITNSIPHSSTVLFPRHLSLAQCSPDLGSCADLNCALGCPFLPQHKNEFFCTANALPWYSETWLCSSVAKGHGSCCPLWLLHATAAVSLLECPARTKGEEKAEGVWCQLVPLTGLLGCSTRGRWAEGTAGEQICSAHPLSRSGGIQLYRERREPEPFWTVLRRKEKGMESGCSSVCWRVFLFPEFKLMDVAGCICEYIKWLKPETGSQMN